MFWITIAFAAVIPLLAAHLGAALALSRFLADLGSPHSVAEPARRSERPTRLIVLHRPA